MIKNQVDLDAAYKNKLIYCKDTVKKYCAIVSSIRLTLIDISLLYAKHSGANLIAGLAQTLNNWTSLATNTKNI